MNARGLVVYGYEPSGHSAAAFAIEEAGRKAGFFFSRVEIAGEHHPAAGLGVARAYHGLLRASPGLYGALYRGAWARSVLRTVRSAYLTFGGARRLREGVRRSGASVVVCPQAAVAAVLSEARRRGELDIPVVSVLTDFDVHPFWTDPPADLILAPTEDASSRLRNLGAVRTVVSGIPVHPAFGAAPSREEARRILALPARAPVVLLTGGGKGLGNLEREAERLLASSPLARLLVLCGANDRLRRLLDGGKRVRAFGPQPPEFVALLMASADLHLGKPGGLSAAESLASGLPMVLTDALPGQEEGNSRYLVASGAAVEGGAAAAQALLRERPRLCAMRVAAAAAGRPDAAARAVSEISDFSQGLCRGLLLREQLSLRIAASRRTSVVPSVSNVGSAEDNYNSPLTI